MEAAFLSGALDIILADDGSDDLCFLVKYSELKSGKTDTAFLRIAEKLSECSDGQSFFGRAWYDGEIYGLQSDR